MTWLLFMDESGHDHRNTPLEVRGGVAIHASKIWSFTQVIQKAEIEAFGTRLADYHIELKGHKLLETKRFEWALRDATLEDHVRQPRVRQFLDTTNKHQRPTREGFSAYGQASLKMVDRIFQELQNHDAKIFAVAIPRGVKPPKGYEFDDFLRKDQNFLFERYFWFLEAEKEHGLIVMDQTEKQNDRRFLQRMKNYFEKSQNGRQRAHWIVPTPLFVDSDLSAGVQAADICIYAINWGFRRPEWNFKGSSRDDIHQRYGGLCGKLQYQGESYDDGRVHFLYGIIFVPDPYNARK